MLFIMWPFSLLKQDRQYLIFPLMIISGGVFFVSVGGCGNSLGDRGRICPLQPDLCLLVAEGEKHLDIKIHVAGPM
jgi:hypothetical protein